MPLRPAHRNLPGFPRSFYILTAVWDRQGLTSLQADTHPVPSEITWRHQRPPQPPPLGPWPRSRHSPLQTARRIRPLPTRLSMACRASSVIPTKGMHRRAAEKAGTKRVTERHRRLGSNPVRAGAAGPCRTCQRAWGGWPSPRGTQGSPLGKWGGQWGAETPRVSLQWVPTLWELGSGR